MDRENFQVIKKLLHAGVLVFDVGMAIHSVVQCWSATGNIWVLWCTASIFWLREFFRDAED
jgi:hypothetical protein